MSKTPKVVAILLYIAGAILLVGGAGTWYTVSDQLAAENITVTDDAPARQGRPSTGRSRPTAWLTSSTTTPSSRPVA